MNDFPTWLQAGFLSLLPISELRGSIPFLMLAHGQPWYLAAPFCVFMNALVAPIALAFLNTVHGLLYKMQWYKGIFDRFVDSKRAKVAATVDKYGWLGLMVFVAIPLPLTGAWTGALGGWLLGMKTGKTIFSVVLGVLVAGAAVTLVVLFGQGLAWLFLGKY